jgi:two-component system, chemotaxis family, response regulator Rcp1
MNPIHILLAEDNDGDILLTREAFAESKMLATLSVVKDGKEAIEFISRTGKYENVEQVDLVLLDINLPKKNGHEVLKFVKGDDMYKQIPVIMLTTSAFEKDVVESYRNFANCYITKPIEVDNFLDVITKIECFWTTIVKLPTNN